MNFLYNVGIGLYASAARLIGHFQDKPRTMLEGQCRTLDTLDNIRGKDNRPFSLWIHAASLGEYEQGRPIIETFLERDPAAKILLTFFSPSGYRGAIKNSDPRLTIAYLPFDTPENARAMVKAVQPQMAIFVKYEFWGNYLEALKDANVPVYLVSAVFRPKQIFFRPWGGMFRKMLKCFKHIYVQDEASKQLLASVNYTSCTVAGDTRFDRVKTVRSQRREIKAVDVFIDNAQADSFTFVIGSSWGADEDVYMQKLLSSDNVRAIIAPHEFDDARLQAMCNRLGADSTALYTEFSKLVETDPEEAAKKAKTLKYLIINTFGLLSSIYRYADVAYVGGGFGAGIHNINEAAVYGIPVLFGPRNSKFIEARELIAAGGAFQINDAKSFADIFERLRSDCNYRKNSGAAADKYIRSKIGATDRICQDLIPLHND